MMPARFESQRYARTIHSVAAAGLLVIASWGLLSASPLAPLKGTPFSLLRSIDDFLLHVSVYTVLAAGVISVFRDSGRTLRHWCISGMIVHALGTELLQAWIPTRSCDPVDLVANLCGIMLGLRLLGMSHLFGTDVAESELQNALQ